MVLLLKSLAYRCGPSPPVQPRQAAEEAARAAEEATLALAEAMVEAIVEEEAAAEAAAAVEAEAQRVTEQRQAFRADQFARAGNLNAHYLTTGPEFWRQSGGQIDAFCDFVGSGGTFAGCTRYFREQARPVNCYLVEPAGAAVIAGQDLNCPDHPIQGGGYAMSELDHLQGLQPDGYVQIDGELAAHTSRLLAQKEGLFAGYSSGANVAAALQLLQGPERGSTIALVLCDAGLKYLSTDLWP